jgi:hypothetical protein
LHKIDSFAGGILEPDLFESCGKWDRIAPLYADFLTEENMKLGDARVPVEVNVDSEFPKTVELYGGINQKVIQARAWFEQAHREVRFSLLLEILNV